MKGQRRFPLETGIFLLFCLVAPCLRANFPLLIYLDQLNDGTHTAFPGETIKLRAVGSTQIELTNPVVSISVYYRNEKVGDFSAAGGYVEFKVPLAVGNQIGEFPVSAYGMDSAGRTNGYEGWIRVSNDYVEIIAPDEILENEENTFELNVVSSNRFGEGKIWAYDITPPGFYLPDVGSWQAPPYKAKWLASPPAVPGMVELHAEAWYRGQHMNYPYRATKKLIAVLPGRLPMAIPTEFKYYSLGETAVLQPRILCRGEARVQWLHNRVDIPGATNATLTLPNLTEADEGGYTILLENFAGAVYVPIAGIVLTNSQPPANGALLFNTHTAGVDAPARQTLPNGPLLGPESKAQLYAGPSLLAMKAVTPAVNFSGGYVNGGVVKIPGVAPGEIAYVQICAWDDSGFPPTSTFETRGISRWGKSRILKIQTKTAEEGGAALTGLEPFGLLIWDGYGLWAYPSPNQVAKVGSTANLWAFGRGTYTWTRVEVTNIVFQWSKNGLVLPGMTQSNLTLVNIQPRDAGIYQVAVSDGQLATAVLTINVSVDSQIPILKATPSANGPVWRLDAADGIETTVQTSSDLLSWNTWQKFAGKSSILFSNVPAVGGGPLFLRAIVE